MTVVKKKNTSSKKSKTSLAQEKIARRADKAISLKSSLNKTGDPVLRNLPDKKPALPQKAVKEKALLKNKMKDTEKTMKDKIQEIKKTLLKKREHIIKETKEEISKYISGETRQLVDTAVDEGDRAVVDISEDISLRKLTKQRQGLRGIDEALRKIDEGTYGICEECGEEISEKRLSVLPTAILCVDCQEHKEKFEYRETQI